MRPARRQSRPVGGTARRWRRRLEAAALVVILFTALGALTLAAWAEGAGDGSGIPLTDRIAASTRELDELRSRIAESRSRLTELRDREQQASSGARELAQEIELTRSLLAGLAERETMLVQQGEALRGRLAGHRERLERRQADLARRMRAVYKRGAEHRWQKILTAGSFSELVTQLRFESLVGHLDARLVAETRREAELIEREQGELQTALTALWEAREEASLERQRLEEAEAEHQAVLRDVQRESERAEADLLALEKRESQLRDLITGLEEQRRRDAAVGDRTAGDTGSSLSAGLDWPARGEVTRSFGRAIHPEYGTVTVNNGIGIAAGQGAPVYAVAAGEVVFADHLPGFGTCVIVDHGAGYYTLYANLGRVFATRGVAVSRGEILAEVGTALPPEETAELYFEIRQGRTPLDPMEWLRPDR
jgi:septal ring factor EnvC (AmiA/AmiB activator)